MSEQNTDQHSEMNEQMEIRRGKLKDLQSKGVNAYGTAFPGVQSSTEVKALYIEEEEAEQAKVRVAGRVILKRVMGKAMFATLQDAQGKIQIYASRDDIGGTEVYGILKRADIGDIIGCDGQLFKTRTGEITVNLSSYEYLSKALRPLPEKFHGLTDVEMRYRQRYVDLIANEESRKVFVQRSQIIAAMRSFLIGRGYLEVETPMMHPIPGGASARPFETHYNALDQEMFMRIAPELYLKMLLVGGMEKVFEINRNFRNEGLSKQHNPEFTALEVYEAYGDMRSMRELTESMVRHIAQEVCGTLHIDHGEGKIIDLESPFTQVAYHDLVRSRTCESWFEMDNSERIAMAKEMGCHVEDNWTEAEITEEVYSKKIEPSLIQPTFITRLPVHMVPLAKRCEDNPELVDVFEFVVDGKELAPGYSELNDAIEQRQRLVDQLSRVEGTEEEQSGRIDENFLSALEHGMPPAGGMGLGVDRLVMLLTTAPTIRDVILFPQLKTQH